MPVWILISNNSLKQMGMTDRILFSMKGLCLCFWNVTRQRGIQYVVAFTGNLEYEVVLGYLVGSV